MPTIAIIGAGVNGLSTGIRLLQSGFNVDIFADKISPNTTSDIAAAIWLPYKAYPEDKIINWARESLSEFLYLEKNMPEAGIAFRIPYRVI